MLHNTRLHYRLLLTFRINRWRKTMKMPRHISRRMHKELLEWEQAWKTKEKIDRLDQLIWQYNSSNQLLLKLYNYEMWIYFDNGWTYCFLDWAAAAWITIINIHRTNLKEKKSLKTIVEKIRTLRTIFSVSRYAYHSRMNWSYLYDWNWLI